MPLKFRMSVSSETPLSTQKVGRANFKPSLASAKRCSECMQSREIDNAWYLVLANPWLSLSVFRALSALHDDYDSLSLSL